MQQVEIRHSTMADIEAINAVHAGPKAYAGTLDLPYGNPTKWQKMLSDLPLSTVSLVALREGQLLGHLMLGIDPHLRRRHIAWFGIWVRDDAQGQGVGSQLLAAAIDLADNWQNIHRLEITVYVDNEAAIALYRKFGFEVEGEGKDYAFRDGRYVNAYYMARIRRQPL
ncbi:GNAT family N-acetyltransferase [uncultured Deefgea sp.]|uniref:GNAT family N-acetyltransferase n=1 Tax=uncultured Deefgea sp. TaxID=1304914 RepID=UPI00262ABE66|nr:GNAT family N-acetyltransferase [uncultured Deefgea sp.]